MAINFEHKIQILTSPNGYLFSKHFRKLLWRMFEWDVFTLFDQKNLNPDYALKSLRFSSGEETLKMIAEKTVSDAQSSGFVKLAYELSLDL